MKNIKNIGYVCLLSASLLACNDDNDQEEVLPPTPPLLMVGASSQSILPTVDGARDYLTSAPGWELNDDYSQNPGVYIAQWDQGIVNVGNGEPDSAWVHDDVRVTAIAMQREESKVILVATDAYMHFAPDVDKMVELAKAELPEEWADAEILINASHNHQGPSTAFSVNPDFYEMMSTQITLAIKDAVGALEPATTKVATTQYGYGTQRDQAPLISDERLNVMTFSAFDDDELLATMVQWAAHPETTLNMKPNSSVVDCPEEEDNCDAEGRYFSADFPGTLQTRLKEDKGGEVLYINGALLAVTTLGTPVWKISGEHPIGDGKTVPQGAGFVDGCEDYNCKNFAVMENIGTQLYYAVADLIDNAEEFEMTELSVSSNSYFTKMTNLSFSYLFANDALGWVDHVVYQCDIPYSVEECVDTEKATIDDPLGIKVLLGDVIESRITRVDFGDIAMMYIPGELTPELVVGLPDDFDMTEASLTKYYGDDRIRHALPDAYTIPGALLDLVDESITFTVGLGGDQLGYHVVISDFKIGCSEDVLAAVGAPSCSELNAYGVVNKTEYQDETSYWVSGQLCKNVDEGHQGTLEQLGALAPVIGGLCRYGQMLEQENDHYHETNGVGWDLAADLFKAAETLYE